MTLRGTLQQFQNHPRCQLWLQMVEARDLFVMIRGEKYQKQCNKLRYALNSYTNIAGMKLEETAALPQLQFSLCRR
jgi:hypothetical protein